MTGSKNFHLLQHQRLWSASVQCIAKCIKYVSYGRDSASTALECISIRRCFIHASLVNRTSSYLHMATKGHVLKTLSCSKHLNILQHVKFMAQIQFKYLRSIYRSICIIHASLAEIGQVITKIQDLQQKIYVQMPTPRV